MQGKALLAKDVLEKEGKRGGGAQAQNKVTGKIQT